MKAICVIPYAYEPYFHACVKTLDHSLDVLAINNTHTNTGVAEAWDRGIDEMYRTGADWLIIISAAMRFGEKKGLDMLQQIEKHSYANIIHFAKADVPEQNYAGADSPPYDSGVFYWHCTAVNRKVFDRIGYFDPNFYPVYYEDTDFDLRFQKGFDDPQRLILPIDAQGSTIGHGVKLGGIEAPAEPNILYFVQKWGRSPEAAVLGEYNKPFNDSDNPLSYFPEVRGRKYARSKD